MILVVLREVFGLFVFFEEEVFGVVLNVFVLLCVEVLWVEKG